MVNIAVEIRVLILHCSGSLHVFEERQAESGFVVEIHFFAVALVRCELAVAHHRRPVLVVVVIGPEYYTVVRLSNAETAIDCAAGLWSACSAVKAKIAAVGHIVHPGVFYVYGNILAQVAAVEVYSQFRGGTPYPRMKRDGFGAHLHHTLALKVHAACIGTLVGEISEHGAFKRHGTVPLQFNGAQFVDGFYACGLRRKAVDICHGKNFVIAVRQGHVGLHAVCLLLYPGSVGGVVGQTIFKLWLVLAEIYRHRKVAHQFIIGVVHQKHQRVYRIHGVSVRSGGIVVAGTVLAIEHHAVAAAAGIKICHFHRSETHLYSHAAVALGYVAGHIERIEFARCKPEQQCRY